MLRLPIERLNELVGSLSGEVIQLSRTIMLSRKPHPFLVCVTKDINQDKGDRLSHDPNENYSIYLIDLFVCSLVGETLRVSASLQFDIFNHYYLLGSNGIGQAFYRNDIRGIWSDLDESKHYREKHMTTHAIYLHDFIFTSMQRFQEGSSNKYEEWVIEYLSKLLLLEEMETPCNKGLLTKHLRFTDKYVDELRTVESELLEDMNILWSKYPLSL